MYRLLDIDCDSAHVVRCFCRSDLVIDNGDMCVFESDGIMECGRVCWMSEIAGEPDASAKRLPTAVRRATLQDQSQASENILFSKSARRLCEEQIRDLELSMSLVRIRFSLDRSRMIVDFTAEDRVDFRKLVQILSAETRARVDMRQIGVRDAAGVVGGLGVCGRSLCCSEWMREFENVNVRMAKIQGVSLSPTTINGMCGRLKCCLRFEHNCYKDLSRGLPRVGSRITCEHGDGRVVAVYLLSRKVKVLLDDNRLMLLETDDIKTLGSR